MKIEKFLFIALMGFTMQLNAQSADYLMNEIHLVKTPEFIRLDWEILGGNTCFGIDIERSIDKKVFTKIGHVSGVCGGVDVEPYFFIDSFPIQNTENCYRVLLGLQGSSSAKCIEYLTFENGFQVRTNGKQIIFLFEYPYSKEIITFYNVSGQKILSETINGTIFNLDASNFSTGIYFFKLGNLTDTKFFIP